jgi:hypothetical protein
MVGLNFSMTKHRKRMESNEFAICTEVENMTDPVSRLELISHLIKMIDLCIKDEVDKLEPYVIALHARFCHCIKDRLT